MKKLLASLLSVMMVVCFMPRVNAESNPLAGAQNMGTSGAVSGTLTQENKVAYYRYTVAAGSSVELNIKYTTDMNASIVAVLDADGNRYDYVYISNRNETGQKTENFSVLLNPGTYYISIKPDLGQPSGYSMSYTTEVLNNTDVTFDDSLSSAHTLPLSTQVTGILSGFCGDKLDIYKLNVAKAGVFEYNLKFYMQNLKMKLLDKDGNEIDSWYFSWNSSLSMGTESIQIPLEPGTYYIEILRDYYDGKYTFQQTYTDIGSTEKEPNNSLEQAQSIALGEKATGMLATGSDTDFFKINIPTKRNVTFNVPSKFKDLVMYIYDAEGNQVKSAYSSWNSNTNKGTLQKIYKLGAGTYYIQLKKYWSNGESGTYTLTASTTKAPAKGKVTTIKRTKKSWGGSRAIYLKWAKSTNAEGYQIYVSTSSKFKKVDKYTTDKRNYTTWYYKTGKTYYVKVRAYRKNSDGEYIYGNFSTVKKIKL